MAEITPKKRGRKPGTTKTPPEPEKAKRKPRKDKPLEPPHGVKKIVTTHGGSECHVHIEGRPDLCGYGATPDEAIAKLVRLHGKALGLEVL